MNDVTLEYRKMSISLINVFLSILMKFESNQWPYHHISVRLIVLNGDSSIYPNQYKSVES